MWLRYALNCLAALLVFSACSSPDRQTVDKLNTVSYAYHYRNIDSTAYYAQQALRCADGYADGHMLPGTGTVEWDKWIPALKKCPRLVRLQNETRAVIYQISIKKLCETFDGLMKL